LVPNTKYSCFASTVTATGSDDNTLAYTCGEGRGEASTLLVVPSSVAAGGPTVDSITVSATAPGTQGDVGGSFDGYVVKCVSDLAAECATDEQPWSGPVASAQLEEGVLVGGLASNTAYKCFAAVKIGDEYKCGDGTATAATTVKGPTDGPVVGTTTTTSVELTVEAVDQGDNVGVAYRVQCIEGSDASPACDGTGPWVDAATGGSPTTVDGLRANQAYTCFTAVVSGDDDYQCSAGSDASTPPEVARRMLRR